MIVIVIFIIVLINTSYYGHHIGCLCKLGVAAALTTVQRRAIALSRIRRGMLLSQEANNNVTAAEEACSVWESVLSRPSISSPTSSIITPDVLSLSKTLYASCLVRVGRDSEAVSVYDSCLDATDFSENPEEFTKWRVSKARCLQRLLKYSEAAEEYAKVVEGAKGSNDIDKSASVMGASTCILRSSGDVVRAREILTEASDDESRLLSYCLEYLETGKEAKAVSLLQEVLSTANVKISKESNTLNVSTTSFLLFQWIYASLKQKHWNKNNPETKRSTSADRERKESALNAKDLFMELIRINASTLDDPNLLRLDDKIELHNLLTTTPTANDYHETTTEVPLSSYWPDGFVLPAQSSELKDKTNNDSQLWISKSRAGYGSHGNQILTLAEARERLNDTGEKTGNPSQKETEPYLLQRMVDPLMLLEGYKFSLRIYVVLFSSDEAYISSKGLVKLASTLLRSECNSEDRNPILDTKMHMTNSGRETVMRQEDLDYLWKELDSDAKKEELWEEISNVAIDTLLVRYPEHEDGESKQAWKTRREHWGIPKILGLDFVVDDRKRPWLVEVNRFPGLEPRDEDDRKIKYKVVKDAWKKASERLLLEDGKDSIFDLLSNDDGSDIESSLELLQS